MTAVYMVRPASPEEIPYLASMGKRLHAKSLFKDMDYNEEQVIAVGNMARTNDHCFLHVIVDLEQDVPIGILMAMVTPTYFGKDFVANDMLLMVEEEHRGKCGAALREITTRYKNWAFHKGAKRVYLSTSTGIDTEKTKEAFEACGFHQVGTLHEA